MPISNYAESFHQLQNALDSDPVGSWGDELYVQAETVRTALVALLFCSSSSRWRCYLGSFFSSSIKGDRLFIMINKASARSGPISEATAMAQVMNG